MASGINASQASSTAETLAYSANPFFDRYGQLDIDAWEAKVVESIRRPEQDGLAFPKFPPQTLQERIHGHSGQHAIHEVFEFYRQILAHSENAGLPLTRDRRLLDFGSGWGRTLRPFMNRLDLQNIYGYEPHPWFCQVARTLNPYVCFVFGKQTPPTIFADRTFDLIISWSVFTHLPAGITRDWLGEAARLLKPGGMLFITVWGLRFIEDLIRDRATLAAGKDIHWYHKVVIEASGDLDRVRQRYLQNEHVFIASSNDPNYGEAFLSPKGAQAMIPRELELVASDQDTLAQDLLVLRRR